MEPLMDKNNKVIRHFDPIILSVHHQKERGTRLYFTITDLKKIKERFGDDFFLFNSKKIMAQIDSTNETIMISPVDNGNVMNDNVSINSSMNFIEALEDDIESDLDDFDDISQIGLDFYIPIEGTGDKYWIAEISINNLLAFYCVAPTKPLLEKEIQIKAKRHFPGILELKQVEIMYFKDYLVHSPVPIETARNAYKNIGKKKIQDIGINPEISIPNDADLTPLVDIGKGNVEGLTIKKRTLLAKYEIVAIAPISDKIKSVLLKNINDRLIWQVSMDHEVLYFDPISGLRIISDSS